MISEKNVLLLENKLIFFSLRVKKCVNLIIIKKYFTWLTYLSIVFALICRLKITQTLWWIYFILSYLTFTILYKDSLCLFVRKNVKKYSTVRWWRIYISLGRLQRRPHLVWILDLLGLIWWTMAWSRDLLGVKITISSAYIRH